MHTRLRPFFANPDHPASSDTMRESRKSPPSHSDAPGSSGTSGPIGAANSTADRAIDILLLFTEDHPVWSASDIAAHFGMPRSTTYRYLNSLRAYALVVEDEKSGFRLGPRIFPLARVAKAHMGVVQLAAPTLREIAARFGELVVLHERVEHDIIALDRIESPQRVSLNSTRSHLLPWPATASAKLLLACAPPAERAALRRMLHPVRYTTHTIMGKAELKAELDRIATRGYALTEEERDEGVWGVAAPILENGAARYCIAIAAPRFRLDGARIQAMIEAVCAGARAVTAALEEVRL